MADDEMSAADEARVRELMGRLARANAGVLPCGCTGSRSVLHLTLHHRLAYAVGAIVAVLIGWVGGSHDGPLAAALAGAIVMWVLAHIIK